MLPSTISRRNFLAGAAAGGLLSAIPGGAAAQEGAVGPGLKDIAARKGMVFGCAVMWNHLETMPGLDAAIARECSVIVAENEMKWRYVQNKPGAPNYRDADRLVGFAHKNRIAVRGHTAMWYRATPGWAELEASGPGGRDLLLTHVSSIVRRFRGVVAEWDVVNEMVEPNNGMANDLRPWPPFAKADIGFIADCFHAAQEADPAARLFYNDYGLEYTDRQGYGQRRRDAVLKVLEGLKDRKAPIASLGIQCHITVGNRFIENDYRSFLSDAASLGYQMLITELDVNDKRVKGSVAERDEAVARHARDVLSVAFDEPAVRGVLTWGLTDRFTWLNLSSNPQDRRPDGAPTRPLPLDEDLRRKPLWQAIADSFEKTGVRA